MIIYKPDGIALLSIEVDDESYHYAEIMGRDDVTLIFSIPKYIDIPVGAYIYIDFQAGRYTLYSVDKMRMEHRRYFEYTITFESVAAELENYIFSNPNDGRFKFPLTARPSEHLSMLCRCMSLKSGQTWTAGDCVEGNDSLISYDAMTCLDALKQMADTFDTEYRIEGTTIHLCKVEFYKDVPDQVAISYGKGNGLRPGVEKTVDDSGKALGKVYIQGGDRNIDLSRYGSSTLLLPRNTRIWYDGTDFYSSSHEGAKEFITSEDGRSVSLVSDDASPAEGALDLTDVYPCHDHHVSAAEEVDADNHFWDIYSDTFWSSGSGGGIDYTDLIIANGEDMTIIFQSGPLAGREFGVKWTKKTVDGETVGCMEIVPSEQDGYTMPDRASGFHPKPEDGGDVFRVFNIYLPDEYIEAAEEEMLHQAVAWLHDHSEQKFSVKGEIDPIWSASRWLEIGGKFKPGAYFRFSDPAWETDGVSIRITSVKTYINRPHCPVVEMSNGSVGQGVSTAIKRIEADASVIPEEKRRSSVAFTKRSFRDAKETMEALAEAMLEGFSERISPITVQTMQMIAGSEALQFGFFTDRTCATPVTNPVSYDTGTKRLAVAACALKHMTLGIDDIKPSSGRSVDEYLRWDMTAYESPALDDASKRYYLYARCDKANDGTGGLDGTFLLSETAIGMEGVNGYYHFLVGILNSERDGSRSFAPLFGYTEILPGQITTDVIRSSSGASFFDLLNNVFNLGDKLQYNVNNSGQLVLNGTFVQTGSGATSAIGAWCGEYDPDRTYKSGDEVYHVNNGLVSSYRYIHPTPASGNAPTDTAYWEITAEGAAGAAGQGVFKSLVFTRSDSAPATPSGGSYLSPIPTDMSGGVLVWSDGVPSGTDALWMSTRVFTSDGEIPQEAVWTTPRKAVSDDDMDYRWSSNTGKPSAPGEESGSSLAWTAAADVPWITLGKSGGTGADTLTYTVAENTGTSSRTGHITVSYSGGSKTFTVTQAGSSPSSGATVSYPSTVTADAQDVRITISDPDGHGWEIDWNEAYTYGFFTGYGIVSGGVTAINYRGASGSGDAVVYVSINANTSARERYIPSGSVIVTFTDSTTEAISYIEFTQEAAS